MIRYACYRLPIGDITVGYEDDAVVYLKIGIDSSFPHNPSPLSDLVAEEIGEYLSGDRSAFTFPIRLTGTVFQKTVWEALIRIPYGQTRTYGQIAAEIGKPKAAQAVGMACSKNPVWIAVPCHRVLGKGNDLTGYAGGLKLKQSLLDLEKSQ